MARSSRPHRIDERRAYELIRECLRFGDDAHAWQTHLVHQLCRLTGACVGIALAMSRPNPSRLQLRHGVAAGSWSSHTAQRQWLERLQDIDVPTHPCLQRFFAHPQPALTCTRQELLDNAVWKRHRFRAEMLLPYGLDEGLISRRPIPAHRGGYLISLLASVGDKPFPSHVGAFVDYVHELLAPHLGRELWLSTQPNLSKLSPRLRQTLERLLAGESERQAARALGISPATLREYVTSLYRHFGVTSRSELLAHFLRRRPSS